MTEAINRAFKQAGGVGRLSEHFKLCRQSIYDWKKHGVPSKRVLELARLAQMDPGELRPDLYPNGYQVASDVDSVVLSD